MSDKLQEEGTQPVQQWTICPVCGCELKARNLIRHLDNVHDIIVRQLSGETKAGRPRLGSMRCPYRNCHSIMREDKFEEHVMKEHSVEHYTPEKMREISRQLHRGRLYKELEEISEEDMFIRGTRRPGDYRP